jgi:hypothetical protein
MHAFDVLVLALRFNEHQVAQNNESRTCFNMK